MRSWPPHGKIAHMKTRRAKNATHFPSATPGTDVTTCGHGAWDRLVIALAVLYVVALGAASFYGLRYGRADTGMAVGKVTITKNEKPLFKMAVNKKMKARISYLNKDLTGTLKLNGAETDTVLFRVEGIAFEDGSDASDAVLFVRMPRSGVGGDLNGAWMVYFFQPSANESFSEWVIAHEDGSADYGHGDNINAITAQRFALEELSEKDWNWNSKGSVLRLERSADDAG